MVKTKTDQIRNKPNSMVSYELEWSVSFKWCPFCSDI